MPDQHRDPRGRFVRDPARAHAQFIAELIQPKAPPPGIFGAEPPLPFPKPRPYYPPGLYSDVELSLMRRSRSQ